MIPLESAILIVDDMKTMRRFIIILLKKIGFSNFLEADNVKRAAGMIKSRLNGEDPIRLIISDWNMPEINGMEFLQMLRKSEATKNIPFIMMSANQDPDKIGVILNLGAGAYLKKPLTIDTLKNGIETASSTNQPQSS